MDLKGKTVLILGGWGLVGSAIVRRLAAERPARFIVTSLEESQARDACAQFASEFPEFGAGAFVPYWGNVFVRTAFKDTPREALLSDAASRLRIVRDTVDDLSDEILHASALYDVITTYRPDALIDCVNTATAIAYQDIYAASRAILGDFDAGRDVSRETIERLLASLYIPQLIRHVQILYQACRDGGVGFYLKIGTSGTGGMGLNIPYTHSEERPSRVLLSKSSVAGAQTLLLFLLGRTPDGPITKEVKPTSTIAWKRIGYGPIVKRGREIDLVDAPVDSARPIGASLKLTDPSAGASLGRPLEAAFIDTGENGIFSRGEFETITSIGQMEMVTAEEIAETVAREIGGGNTGRDVVAALDGAVMDSTYRAGVLRTAALERLSKLEAEHGSESVAFEMLGPPRLSKLLWEAHLIKVVAGTIGAALELTPADLSAKTAEVVARDQWMRSHMLSIGIPILLPDERLLRGPEIKIPPHRGHREVPVTPERIEEWAAAGWVDLRPANFTHWQSRIRSMMAEASAVPATDTSSRTIRNTYYWNEFGDVEIGKLVAWIFTVEDRGERMKS